MGFGAKPQCKSAFVCGFCIVQNLCANAIKHLCLVAGAAAPDNKPLPEGKGLGVRDREIALLIKKIDFFDKLKGRQMPTFNNIRIIQQIPLTRLLLSLPPRPMKQFLKILQPMKYPKLCFHLMLCLKHRKLCFH